MMTTRRIETDTIQTVADLRAAIEDLADDTLLTFGKVLKSQQKSTCWCGCGGETGGKFVPGHDSRFHSLAKKAARDQEPYPTEFVNDEAEADFAMWYERELPIWQAGQPLRDLKAAGKADKTKTTTKVKSVKQLDKESSEYLRLMQEMATVED